MAGALRAALVAALLCGTARLHAAPPADAFPDVARAYLVEVDGQPLWAGRAEARLPMASLTKLMTALLVAEDGDFDAVAVVSEAASRATGTRLGIRAGERIRVRDLFNAMLVRSANDVCRALADHQGGTTAAFIARMNARAAELGLDDTRFENACGHDGRQQYSSARDLARLAREAMKHPAVAEAVARRSFAFASLDGRRYTMNSTNPLLEGFAGTRGIKTGFTPDAGRCLVALAERDGVEVLVVLLHATDRWWDTVGLMQLAFDHAQRPQAQAAAQP